MAWNWTSNIEHISIYVYSVECAEENGETEKRKTKIYILASTYVNNHLF